MRGNAAKLSRRASEALSRHRVWRGPVAAPGQSASPLGSRRRLDTSNQNTSTGSYVGSYAGSFAGSYAGPYAGSYAGP